LWDTNGAPGYPRPVSHLRNASGAVVCDHAHDDRDLHGDAHDDDHTHDHTHDHAAGHGHSHGLVDRSIVRSREGVKAVSLSLAVLGIAAVAQLLIFLLSGSVALLADLIPRVPEIRFALFHAAALYS